MRIILLSLLFFSCSRDVEENKTCWTCDVYYLTGEVVKKDTCTATPKFQDVNGNDLNSTCEKR